MKIITAINNKTKKREEVSTRLTLREAVGYLTLEFSLHKTHPCGKGLYAEYSDIRVINA